MCLKPRMTDLWRLGVLAVAACVGMIPSLSQGASAADIQPRTVQILGRMISFVSGGPSGHVTLGIVFDPSNAASKNEADALAAVIGNSLNAGTIQLSARLVPINSLAAAGNLDALFVTSGLGTFDGVLAYTSQHRIVSITLDEACIAQSKCVMSFRSDPKVEISVSRSAATASGVVFGNAFRIMIREVS